MKDENFTREDWSLQERRDHRIIEQKSNWPQFRWSSHILIDSFVCILFTLEKKIDPRKSVCVRVKGGRITPEEALLCLLYLYIVDNYN